ncbi:hypothetical protein N2152v2_007240 [Parachlorella kessleri]
MLGLARPPNLSPVGKVPKQAPKQRVAVCQAAGRHPQAGAQQPIVQPDRRLVLAAAAAASCSLLLPTTPASAVQGITAGRIPGITGPDAQGFLTYTRPEGKSGGHGVGWSEVPRYSFQVPAGWEEVPVSIADLGGTEIDLRFSSDDQGKLQVVVAPVLRFRDVGYNADVRIDELVPPERLIEGFAPELYGKPITEEDVLDTRVEKYDGVPYYLWELRPHNLVTATAVGNRVFILAVSANGRQWRKGEDKLRHIQESFRVPELA